ncbi:MAG: zinc-dependent alcohol dehydrogenase family protein [Pirellulales bacterium]
MRAAVFDEFGGPLEVREVPDPRPAPDGVVIRVEANGICRSDWHGWMGHDSDVRLPHVPGHEMAGVVEAVGAEVRRWQPGDRVTVPFCCGCGTCGSCRQGDLHICEDYFQPGFTAWGAFAQRVAIRYADHNLVRLPDNLDMVTAASLGCRFATAFRAVVHQGQVQPGQWLVVIGCGGVGLSAVMVGLASGARVIAVDRREAPLEIARRWGAISVPFVDRRATVQAVRELTDGGAHLTIDAVGSGDVGHTCIQSLRRRGRHVHVGLLLGDEFRPRVPLERVIAFELTLVGSHGMPAHHYSQMLRMVSAGQLRPTELVTARVPLSQAGDVLRSMTDFAPIGVTVIDQFDA